jgi:hypothetical protein
MKMNTLAMTLNLNVKSLQLQKQGREKLWKKTGIQRNWRTPKSRGETPLEGFTKSSCEKLRLGSTLPASNSKKG